MPGAARICCRRTRRSAPSGADHLQRSSSSASVRSADVHIVGDSAGVGAPGESPRRWTIVNIAGLTLLVSTSHYLFKISGTDDDELPQVDVLAECLRDLLGREGLDLVLQLAVIGKRAAVEEQVVQHAGQGRVVGTHDCERRQMAGVGPGEFSAGGALVADG